MLKSSRFEKNKNTEDNITKVVRNFVFRIKKKIDDATIKDVINLFRLKKYIDDTTVKDIRNHFRLKKENEAIKNRQLEILGTFLSMKKKIIINQ